MKQRIITLIAAASACGIALAAARDYGPHERPEFNHGTEMNGGTHTVATATLRLVTDDLKTFPDPGDYKPAETIPPGPLGRFKCTNSSSYSRQPLDYPYPGNFEP